jgi:hypothetical protein
MDPNPIDDLKSAPGEAIAGNLSQGTKPPGRHGDS